MPADYDIDPARARVTSRLSGRVTDDDVIALQQRLLGDPGFLPAFDHLIDATDVTAVDVTAAVVRRLVELVPPERAGRRVIVAPADVTFGLGRMLEHLSEGRSASETSVVRTRVAAHALLDDGRAPREP